MSVHITMSRKTSYWERSGVDGINIYIFFFPRREG